MTLPVKIILIVVLVLLFLLSSIYSGSETAYSTLSPAKLHDMQENKSRFAHLIAKQSKRYNQILSTILIGNNLVNVSSATLMSLLLNYTALSDTQATIISTAIVTPLLVLFGEIVPKLVAKSYPVAFLKTFCIFIEINYWLFFVLTFPISKLSRKVYETNSEEDIKSFLKIAQNEGVLETSESILAQNALNLDSTKVISHYVKLKDVQTIDYKSTVKDALRIFKETNYSRLPVIKEDTLIGVILIKDIFDANHKDRIIDYLKNVPFISANSILSSALEKLRFARSHMGFVVPNNNSNETIGIITIEDIIEEIIGEIYDEYDDDEEIYEISLAKSRVQSNLYVYDVFKQLDIDLTFLTEEEEELDLRSWLLKRTNKIRLTKNFRYNLEDEITFKVVEIIKGPQHYAIIEIHKL
ncbi:CNNM domain-containing protein [Mycoplasmopsis glycophila]|uniref:Mg2+ and Co2+ transporter CorB n=1 Tax=Mycoplasmopsis glycophila TaxID=171285 RepID=A0A449AV72_9BACT|nr:CNNM domain-containing protein [Mycoplasmopsis glycophila]VEU70395.1 Putative Mg2+ and Co2+ transporter CorB [Mycoplasmopsis glycophila]